MLSWGAWLIAIISTAVCLLFWFRDVRRIMRERKSTVEFAAAQLVSCQEMVNQATSASDAIAVLERSEDIYRQAVDIYNRTMRKPWIHLPAYLMGFRPIPQKGAAKKMQ